jgi:hypothetical protein
MTRVGAGLPTCILGLTQSNKLNYVMDKVQVTVFFVQEILLSALYIYKARRYFKDSIILAHNESTVRNVMQQLLLINDLIKFLDITILILSLVPGLCYIQAALKPCVYAVKVRLEFSILNRLVNSVQRAK